MSDSPSPPSVTPGPHPATCHRPRTPPKLVTGPHRTWGRVLTLDYLDRFTASGDGWTKLLTTVYNIMMRNLTPHSLSPLTPPTGLSV